MSLLHRFGETVTLERPDGTTVEVAHVLCSESDMSDQTVMDVQTRFINQARYKGDQRTLTIFWPTSADHDVMDCYVWVRGERYAIYGEPFPVAHSPVGYDMQLTATRSLYLYDVELGSSTLTRDEWGAHHAAWQWVSVRANMLRLAEDTERGSGTEDVSRIVMFEFTADAWGDGYEAVRYPCGDGGHVYHHTATAIARDSVVCTFTGGVADE
jgi:hypothetical protein